MMIDCVCEQRACCLLKIFQNRHERFVEKFSMEFLSHVG